VFSFIGNIFGFFSKVLPLIFAWKAGKDSAQASILEKESEIMEDSNEVERDVDRMSDDTVRKQLRDNWTKQK
jgi:hypothetical protein